MPTWDARGSSAAAERLIAEGRSFVCRGCDTVMSEMHAGVEKSEEKEAQAQAQASTQALSSERRRIVGDMHRPQTFGIAFLIFYLSCKASKS